MTHESHERRTAVKCLPGQIQGQADGLSLEQSPALLPHCSNYLHVPQWSDNGTQQSGAPSIGREDQTLVFMCLLPRHKLLQRLAEVCLYLYLYRQHLCIYIDIAIYLWISIQIQLQIIIYILYIYIYLDSIYVPIYNYIAI